MSIVANLRQIQVLLFGTFWNVFFQKFLNRGWLNQQIQNPWIQRPIVYVNIYKQLYFSGIWWEEDK